MEYFDVFRRCEASKVLELRAKIQMQRKKTLIEYTFSEELPKSEVTADCRIPKSLRAHKRSWEKIFRRRSVPPKEICLRLRSPQRTMICEICLSGLYPLSLETAPLLLEPHLNSERIISLKALKKCIGLGNLTSSEINW